MITIILVILFGIFTTINSYISSCGNSSTCKCSFTSLDALNMDYDDNMGIEMIVDFSEWSRLEIQITFSGKQQKDSKDQ
ncbi:hypothetical protein M0802_011863 [Mischocyttarus mexicanus]|nr:hypothetical protein M0802_011863 [Mischocyttarus mexicanus]